MTRRSRREIERAVEEIAPATTSDRTRPDPLDTEEKHALDALLDPDTDTDTDAGAAMARLHERYARGGE